LFAYFLSKLAAPKPAKGSIPAPGRLPGIGHLLRVEEFRSDPVKFTLDTSRQLNFKTFSVQFPGDVLNPFQSIIIHDEKDRYHTLKGNFENYPKNYDETTGLEQIFPEMMGGGIFAVDGDKWKTHRKIAANLFTGRNINVIFSKTFAEHAILLEQTLLKFAEEGKSFDIQLLFQALIFDTFCVIAFGHSPNSFNDAVKGVKEPFQVAFDEAQRISSERLIDPPMVREAKKFFEFGEEKTLKSHVEVLNSYVNKISRQRLQEFKNGGNKTKNDVVGLYMNFAAAKGRDELLEEEYIRDLIINFMIAGRDTTSCVLTNVVSLMTDSPDYETSFVQLVQEKMKGGIDNFLSVELKHFPQADAVFFEALRLYPSVGNDVRYAQHDDILPSGVQVKAGNMIVFPNQSCGRNPKYFDNPDTFNPERWLTTHEGKVECSRLDEFKFPFFHGGYRICLGKDMARQEAKIFMSVLFNTLRFSYAKPRVEKHSNGPVMFYSDGVHMFAHKR